MLSKHSANLPSLSLWEKSILNNDQDSERTEKHLEKSVAGNFQEAKPVGRVLFPKMSKKERREREFCSVMGEAKCPVFPRSPHPPEGWTCLRKGYPLLALVPASPRGVLCHES